MAVFTGLRESTEEEVSFDFTRTHDAITKNWHCTRLGIDLDSDSTTINYLAEKTASNISFLRYPLNLRIEQGFKHICQLSDDWDTYGAKAPSQTVIEKAKLLSRYFPSEIQPEIQPETNGSIGLYWDYNDYTYCLLVSDFEKEDEIKIFIETVQGQRYEHVGAIFEIISAFSKNFRALLNK